MADNRVEIILTADGSQAKAEVRGTADSLQILEQQAAKAATSTKALAGEGGGLAAAFGGVKGMLAGLGLTAFASELLSTNVEFAKLRGALETASGSAAAAQSNFAWIQDFAATTPFSLAQAVDGFVKLKNLGLDPSREALTAYGNVAAAMGKDLNQMIEAVADAATGEFERLKEFGIRASKEGDQVSLTFQGVTTTIGNSAAEIEGYLRSLGEVNFGGAMDKQTATLAGAVSNLGDSWDRMLDNMLSGVTEGALADGIRLLAEGLDGLSGLFVDLNGEASSTKPALDSLGTATSATAGEMDRLAGSAGNAASGIAGVGAASKTAGIEMLGGMFASASAASASLSAELQNATTHYSEMYATVGGLASSRADIAGALEEQGTKVRVLAQALQSAEEQETKYKTALTAVSDAVSKANDKTGKLTTSRTAAQSSTKALGAEEDRLEQSYQRTIQQLELERIALEEGEDAAYRASLALQGFDETHIASILTLKEHNDTLRAQAEVLEEQEAQWGRWVEGAADAQREAADEAARQSETMAREWQRAADSISSDLADAFLDGDIKGAAESLQDWLIDLFKSTVLRPTISALFTGSSGAGGILSAITGSSGTTGTTGTTTSGISSLLNIGSGIGGIATSLGGTLGSLGLTSVGSGLASAGASISSGGILSGGLTSLSTAGSALASGSIGTAIGAALPVVGTIAALASTLLGSFGNGSETDPKISFYSGQNAVDAKKDTAGEGGKSGGYVRYATGSSALSNLSVGISERGDTYSGDDIRSYASEKQDVIDALVELDNILADRLSAEQVAAAKAAAELAQSKESIDLDSLIKDRYTAIFDAIGGSMEALYDSLVADGASGTDAITATLSLVSAIDGLSTASVDAYGAISDASKTAWQREREQAAALGQLIAEFDATVDSTNELTSALSERYATETELIVGIEAARDEANASLNEAIRGYREAGFSTSQLYAARASELAVLQGQLSAALDPTDISALTGEIQSLTGELVSLGATVADEWASAFADALGVVADAQASVAATLGDQIEAVKQSQMDEATLYEYLTAQAEELAASLSAGGMTATQIQETVSQISALSSQAYGLLDAAQIAGASTDGFNGTVGEETQSFLESVLALANEQLTAAQLAVEAQYATAPDVLTAADAADTLVQVQEVFNGQMDAAIASIQQTNAELVARLEEMMGRITAQQQGAATLQVQAAQTSLEAARTPTNVVVRLIDNYGEVN